MAKKTKSTGSELAVRGETALANWDAELAKHAAAASEKEHVGGKSLSARAGILNIAGEPVAGNKLRVIVLGSVFRNAFYENKFDADNVQSPSCAAIAEDEEQLKPADTVEFKQHDTCNGCPQNAYGTADTGKGKACKNGRRLMLLSGDDISAQALRDGEMLGFDLPVTSVKGWSMYVKGLASNFKRPPFAVITEIGAVPDPKVQFRITFRMVDGIDAEVGAVVMKRRDEALKDLLRPPTTLTSAEKDAKPEKPAKGKSKPGFNPPKAKKGKY